MGIEEVTPHQWTPEWILQISNVSAQAQFRPTPCDPFEVKGQLRRAQSVGITEKSGFWTALCCFCPAPIKKMLRLHYHLRPVVLPPLLCAHVLKSASF